MSQMEKAMATHSSTLAWKIPWAEEPGGLPSMGSHRVGHDWSDLAAAAMSQIVMSENCLMASSISTPTPFETFEFQQGIPILSSRTHSAHSLWRWDAGMVAGEGQSWAGQWNFRFSSCNYEMLFPLTLSSALPSHKRMQPGFLMEGKSCIDKMSFHLYKFAMAPKLEVQLTQNRSLGKMVLFWTALEFSLCYLDHVVQ